MALTKAKLKKAKSNNGCKIYRRLKKFFETKSDTQFMRLTREYYTFSYKDFANITQFLDYIKLLEEQINTTKVTITEYKRTPL